MITLAFSTLARYIPNNPKNGEPYGEPGGTILVDPLPNNPGFNTCLKNPPLAKPTPVPKAMSPKTIPAPPIGYESSPGLAAA